MAETTAQTARSTMDLNGPVWLEAKLRQLFALQGQLHINKILAELEAIGKAELAADQPILAREVGP